MAPLPQISWLAAEAVAQTGLAALPILVPLLGVNSEAWHWAADSLCQLINRKRNAVADQACAALREHVPLLLETLDRADAPAPLTASLVFIGGSSPSLLPGIPNRASISAMRSASVSSAFPSLRPFRSNRIRKC